MVQVLSLQEGPQELALSRSRTRLAAGQPLVEAANYFWQEAGLLQKLAPALQTALAPGLPSSVSVWAQAP